MNIKDASEISGLPPKTIRYYEQIGLVAPSRAENGYRSFRPRDLERLDFLARARRMGFSIEDCRALLGLRENPSRASADVKAIAEGHLAGIDDRIAALGVLRDQLSQMVRSCAGNSQPDCAILDGLSRASDSMRHS